jgi:SAM-dependent methyltransferase
MSGSFQDHFSGHAQSYAQHLPVYPDELFDELAKLAPSRGLAWDVACGNGQASVSLARHFERVFASDASAEQLSHARPDGRVQYAHEPAESPSLAAGSVDAVFVGQALHWLRFDAFYEAVRRVAKPGAPIVAVLYDLAEITPAIDRELGAFYTGAIGPFWPGDRRHIDEHYAAIPWPFRAVDFPVVPMTVRWTLDEMMGYLRTWSAVQRYVAAGHGDPVPALRERLGPLWGDGSRDVTWPLWRLAGRV